MAFSFKGEISKFETGLWSFHIIVPQDIVVELTRDCKKRVMCRINEYESFHAGFMPDGKGNSFIKLNKERMKNFQLELGMEVNVILEKDHSKYGMAMPEEFEEVLGQDIDGASFFEKLTDGKKRSLIYAVSIVKNSDKRITKALIILDHLKANAGKLDFRALNQAFKEGNKWV
ncbi:MAG: YdeI/OmpD-associated family protein [Bacteroidia bacterium]|nr:YdeI/OmpD-associated family protein [Bacteroidia bacterium]